jgi:hypothetical protein
MHAYLIGSILILAVVPIVLLRWEYSYAQILFASLLIIISSYPAVRYLSHKETGIPALAMLCIAYAVQFGVPIFTRDATIELAFHDIQRLSSADVVAALIMAILGVIALQGGYYGFRHSKMVKALKPVSLHLNKSRAILYCIVAGVLLPLLLSTRGLIPEQYQLPLSSILRVLQNQIFVVIGILGWLAYARPGSRWFQVWLYALVIIAVVSGMAEGSLESAIVPIAVLFVVKWLHTRRLPWATITVVFVIVVFLSPVKAEYRGEIWFGDVSDREQSSVSKALLWFDKATEYWGDTLAGERDLLEATSGASGRSDFIHQVAHIHSLTPSIIPFQYGATYSYFAVALIPRALWPDKPLSGSANDFFAVTYGIATEEGVKTTTFGVSLLGEAFINFSWYGVVVVMFIQGLVIGLCQYMFGENRSGAGGNAVFLAFFVFFLNGIGSSAEILFGNILQNLLFGYLLLLWARKKPSKIHLVETRTLRPAEQG